MDTSNNNPPEASLLGLPPELRLRIYACLFEDDDLRLSLIGTADGQYAIAKIMRGSLFVPWVCKQLHRELRPYLPPIHRIQFHFKYFTARDAERYLKSIGDQYVRRIRRITICGKGKCGTDSLTDGQHGYRSRRCRAHMGREAECGSTCEKSREYLEDGVCGRKLELDFTMFDPNLGCFPTANMREMTTIKTGCCMVRPLEEPFITDMPDLCAERSIRYAIVVLLSTCGTRFRIERKNLLGVFEAMNGDYSSLVFEATLATMPPPR